MSTILMRTDLFADARVLRIISATKAPKSAVVGALYWLWSTAQTQSTNGTILCLTPEMIDEQTGVSGFASALVSVGWLEVGDDAVTIPGFESYFGKSSKTRAKERLKKARQRWDRKNEGANRGHTGDTKGTDGGHEGDTKGTSSGHVGAVDRIGLDRSGSDQSGEDRTPPEAGVVKESFDKFWNNYPTKGAVARTQCWTYWCLNNLTASTEQILSGLERWKKSDDWKKDNGKFIFSAKRFLEETRWENAPAAKGPNRPVNANAVCSWWMSLPADQKAVYAAQGPFTPEQVDGYARHLSPPEYIVTAWKGVARAS